MGIVILLLAACGGKVDKATSKLESKVGSVSSSETDGKDTKVLVEEFHGYWMNDDYSYYLTDERLFVYNLKTEDSHRYTVEKQEFEEGTLEVTFDNETSIQMTFNGSDLEISGNNSMLYTDDSFKQASIEDLDILFLVFIENEGKTLSNQADLDVKDFEGYWAPFNATEAQKELIPIGHYIYYISENLHTVGYFGSEGYGWYIQDFEINGNTMTIWMENADDFDVWGYSMGEVNHIDMELIETKVTLFQEEDRDRLVFHESGRVLQRITKDELKKTTIMGQTGDNYFMHPQAIENATSVMEQVAESDLTVTRKTEIASDLQIENYPYSLGDLTEVQLFREHMIIKELLKPLEDEVSEEEALEDILARSYESTPSFTTFSGTDTGYYFSEKLLLSKGALGSYEHKTNSRKDADELLGKYEVFEATFEEQLYTMEIKNIATAEMDKKYFYRIDAETLYELDEDGNILGRYATNTDWEDYEGMPKR